MMMFFAKERFGEIGHQYRNLVCDSNEDGDKDDHEYGGGTVPRSEHIFAIFKVF